MRTVGELNIGDAVYIGVRFHDYDDIAQSWIDTDYISTPFYVVHHGKPEESYDESFVGCTVLQGFSAAWRGMGPFNLTDAEGDGVKTDYAGTTAHRSGCLADGTVTTARFGGRIDPAIQAVLQTVRIPYRVGTSGKTVASGSSGLEAKIFLPSMAEVSRGVRGNFGSTYSFYVKEGALFDYWRQVQVGTVEPKYADWRGHHTERVSENGAYHGEGIAENWCLRTPVESASSKLFYTVGTNGAAVTQTYGAAESYSNPCIVVPDGLKVDDSGTLRAGNGPVFHGKINGVWKESEASCRIGGAWKQASDAFCRINGVWNAQ